MIISAIDTVVAGAAIGISIDNANTTYPGGVFTLSQTPVFSFTVENRYWSYNSSTSKLAYSTYYGGRPVSGYTGSAGADAPITSNVYMQIRLSSGAVFNTQAGDYISINGTNIPTLPSLSGNTASFTINSSDIVSTAFTASSISIVFGLSYTRLGTTTRISGSNSTTINNTQPQLFNVGSISGSYTSPIPYWSLAGTWSWNLSSITGSIVSSTATYSYDGGAPTSFTTSTSTSGTGPSVADRTKNITLTYTATGTGVNPSTQTDMGVTRTATITGASKYYPAFYVINSSASAPSFDPTTYSRISSSTFYVGQQVTTSGTASNYLWVATPQSVSWASKKWQFTVSGFTADATPAVTTTQTISGVAYDVFGFTNYTSATVLTSVA